MVAEMMAARGQIPDTTSGESVKAVNKILRRLNTELQARVTEHHANGTSVPRHERALSLLDPRQKELTTFHFEHGHAKEPWAVHTILKGEARSGRVMHV